MFEPIFRAENFAAYPELTDVSPDASMRARDRALLWRATTLAIESAFTYGKDLPVGATAAAGNFIVGRYFSSDQRNGYKQMHAEYMTVMDATTDPDTVVVTLEPCDSCQDFLAGQPGIRRVGFGLSREGAAAKGLVKPRSESIFQRALRVGLPYEIIRIDDPHLQQAGRILFENVSRDILTEAVEIDRIGLQNAIVSLNGQ